MGQRLYIQDKEIEGKSTTLVALVVPKLSILEALQYARKDVFSCNKHFRKYVVKIIC